MATRIIREGILRSEVINSLSPAAELFYRRLMTVADDYGRYYANPAILRPDCYPLQLDKVTEANVTAWRDECVSKGAIRLYGDGKYLEIPKFNQRTRYASKFPEPDVREERNTQQSQSLSQSPASGAAIVSPIAQPKTGESPVYSESKADAKAKSKPMDIIFQLEAAISQLYSRPIQQLWTYAEASTLAEIARRPGAWSEWELILKYRKLLPRDELKFHWPGAVMTLLNKWPEILDKARTLMGSKQHVSQAQPAKIIHKADAKPITDADRERMNEQLKDWRKEHQ